PGRSPADAPAPPAPSALSLRDALPTFRARHDDVRLTLRNALDAVGPLACDLDGGLDRFGAGVHRQHHLGAGQLGQLLAERAELVDRKSTRLNSSHVKISYAVLCLKKRR